MEIINCSINYTLQPILQPQQLVIIAIDWQKVLEPIIPESKIGEIFRAAVISHKSSFAVNMHDLINVYRENKETDDLLSPDEVEKEREKYRNAARNGNAAPTKI